MYHKARLSETKVSFIIRIKNLMLSSIYRCALYIGKPRHSHINKGIKRNLNKYILKPIKKCSHISATTKSKKANDIGK